MTDLWKHRFDELNSKYEEEISTNTELGRRIEVWKTKCNKEYARNEQLSDEIETWKAKYKSIIRNPANVKLGEPF